MKLRDTESFAQPNSGEIPRHRAACHRPIPRVTTPCASLQTILFAFFEQSLAADA
jgi:hypothetical protein